VRYLFLILLLNLACGKKEKKDSVDIQEYGQQVGDMMAALDEAGGGQADWVSSRFLPRSLERTYYRYEKKPLSFIDSAHAAACAQALSAQYQKSGNPCQMVRTFNDCTSDGLKFSGEVNFQFSTADCNLSGSDSEVTRAPNVSIDGRRKATLKIMVLENASPGGQEIKRIGADPKFEFTSGGVRRYFQTSSGRILFDTTSRTLSPIIVEGQTRSDRKLTGGTFRVLDNKSKVSCDYIPQNVAWSATCNCGVSGEWLASCTDGSSAKVVISSCGKAQVEYHGKKQEFQFDSCFNL
jgi:hypothetical protein